MIVVVAVIDFVEIIIAVVAVLDDDVRSPYSYIRWVLIYVRHHVS